MLVYRVTHQNINKISFTEPQKFNHILFDSNLNCNLHCLYCHNSRDLNTVKEEDFIRFINTQIESTEIFQIGCAMEPTMDKRLTWFAKTVKESKARPTLLFRLQTNGLLLDRHNIDELREAGINRISISMDTVDPETHKNLRGGSDVFKIMKNIEWLRERWPDSNIQLITTVSKLNINGLGDLAKFAVSNKVLKMELRKMFYYPASRVIQNHDKMKEMSLENAVFLEAANKLKEQYKGIIDFHVSDEGFLNEQERLATSYVF
jgi:MoaA/NifB/PqqE/SkfB family radical SAM enzyme